MQFKMTTQYRQLEVVWNNVVSHDRRSYMFAVQTLSDQSAALFIVYNDVFMRAVYPDVVANANLGEKCDTFNVVSTISYSISTDSGYNVLQEGLRAGLFFFFFSRLTQQLSNFVSGAVAIDGTVDVAGTVTAHLDSSEPLVVKQADGFPFKVVPSDDNQPFTVRSDVDSPLHVTASQLNPVFVEFTNGYIVQANIVGSSGSIRVAPTAGQPLVASVLPTPGQPLLIDPGVAVFTVAQQSGQSWLVRSDYIAPLHVVLKGFNFSSSIVSPVPCLIDSSLGPARFLPVFGAVNAGMFQSNSNVQPFEFSGEVFPNMTARINDLSTSSHLTIAMQGNLQMGYGTDLVLATRESTFLNTPLSDFHPAVAIHGQPISVTLGVTDITEQKEPVLFREKSRSSSTTSFEKVPQPTTSTKWLPW